MALYDRSAASSRRSARFPKWHGAAIAAAVTLRLFLTVQMALAHGRAFKVGKISIGAVHDFKVAENLSLGVGGLFAVNFVPDGLASLYGGNNPTGAMGFVRL
jgi:hypothetical protein